MTNARRMIDTDSRIIHLYICVQLELFLRTPSPRHT